MQRSAAGPNGPVSAPPSVARTLASAGHPLDASTRAFMEPRFGRDFSRVRVHSDSSSAESARAVNANAYTVGQHIVFDEGKYNPSSQAGKRLLAHELAHTVQQEGVQRSPVQGELRVSDDGGALEGEARDAAASVMQGRTPVLSRSAANASVPLFRSPWGTCPEGERESAQPPNIHNSAELKAVEYYNSLAQNPKNVITNQNKPEEIVAPAKHKKMLDAIVGEFRTAKPTPARFQATLPVARGEITPPARSTEPLEQGEPGEESSLAAVEGRTRARVETNELLRPDIADLDSREVYDVTTIGQADAKVAKIATEYVEKLERLRQQVDPNSKPWTAGTKLAAPPREILVYRYDKSDPKRAICYGLTDFALRPGVIAYEPIVVGPGGSVAATTEPYEIVTKLGKLTLDANPEPSSTDLLNTGPNNLSAAKAIDGLVMKTLKRGKTGVDTITACVLSEGCVTDKPPLPVTILSNEGNVELKVDKTSRALSLGKSYTGLKFKSKYLSEGVLTKLDFDPGVGVSAKGSLTPSIPLLNRLKLGVELSPDSFAITSGLDEDSLKKISAPFPGTKVTKAQLQLQLYPDFKPEGILDFQIGKGSTPLATAHLSITGDTSGLVATGKLNFNIPKMKTAETDLTYKAGGGRSEWSGEIHIKSEDINLGTSVSVTGGFDGRITSEGLDFVGSINATFPGNNTAELGLKKKGEDWTLFGGGTLHFPKLDETKVSIDYNLGKDVLTASGSTGFSIESLNLKGRLEQITFVIEPGTDLKVYGKGKGTFKKGKAEGDVSVELHPDGKFSGKGKLQYQLKPNLIVSAEVELTKQQKLHLAGELVLTRYELFEKKEGHKDFITLGMKVPVPGLSFGPAAGVMFHIRGGVGAAYSFGPGVIEPLKISAKFDPLEADPNAEIEVMATVKVPAMVSVTAFIEGELALEVDVLVGSAGAAGGLHLSGSLILSAGAFAKVDAKYKDRHLTAKGEVGLDTQLLLAIALSAYVRAWAGAFGFNVETRKDWTLASKQIDTGLNFFISAPIEYADDKPFKFPSVDDITIKKPDVSVDNMKRILGELFGSAPEKTSEKQ